MYRVLLSQLRFIARDRRHRSNKSMAREATCEDNISPLDLQAVSTSRLVKVIMSIRNAKLSLKTLLDVPYVLKGEIPIETVYPQLLDPKRTRLHREGEGPDPSEGQGRDVDLLRPGQEDLSQLEVRKNRLASGQQQPRRGRVRNGPGPETPEDYSR